MNQVADEAGVELQQEMKGVDAGPVKDKAVTEEEREEGLGERLRALRN
jgi:charged multivesicular body protein 1